MLGSVRERLDGAAGWILLAIGLCVAGHLVTTQTWGSNAAFAIIVAAGGAWWRQSDPRKGSRS
jgi:hypothetical protein